MKKHGKCGDSTKSGYRFEKKVDLLTHLKRKNNFKVFGADVVYNKKYLGTVKNKFEFLSYIKEKGVDVKKLWSARLLPDNVLITKDRLVVIEVKFQKVCGSVDEKLQTCLFKKRQYEKLGKLLNKTVEYCYLLNDFFKNERYVDVLEFIEDVGCKYFFNEIPLEFLIGEEIEDSKPIKLENKQVDFKESLDKQFELCYDYSIRKVDNKIRDGGHDMGMTDLVVNFLKELLEPLEKDSKLCNNTIIPKDAEKSKREGKKMAKRERVKNHFCKYCGDLIVGKNKKFCNKEHRLAYDRNKTRKTYFNVVKTLEREATSAEIALLRDQLDAMLIEKARSERSKKSPKCNFSFARDAGHLINMSLNKARKIAYDLRVALKEVA